MSIVSVESITLVGMIEDKERILEELQDLGCLHLRSLRPSVAMQPTRESLTEETREAWRFLKDCPRKRRQSAQSDRFDPVQMQARALDLQRKIRDLGDERDFLRARIADVRRWGQFQFAPPEEMAGLSLWFYIVPEKSMNALQETGLTWEIVHRDHQFVYVVVVSDMANQVAPRAMADRYRDGVEQLREFWRRNGAAPEV